ncbi:MAG: hypothetical protein WA840_18785 [Caulobacteraceae bacterium]
MLQASALTDLRSRIAAIERHTPKGGPHPRVQGIGTVEAAQRALSFGLESVDSRFSLGGLAHGVHQAAGEPGDRSAAGLFVMLWLARLLKANPDRPALVVQEAAVVREEGALYGPGLLALGLDPGRLAVVLVQDGAEALRVVDQAVRSGAVCAVMAELRRAADKLDLGLTQRLNVHGQQTSTLVALLTPDLDGTSAALSRWRVRTGPSRARKRHLGPPALELELVRNRHGRPGRWTLEWSSEDEAFRLPAPFRAPLVSPPVHRPGPPRLVHTGPNAPGADGEIEIRVAAYGAR